MTNKPNKKLIQSVDRALAILDYACEKQRPVSLSELTAELGIDKSSAFRLCDTLISRGYFRQLEDTKEYVLGSKCLRLGRVLARQLPFHRIAHPYVRQLAEQTGEASHAALLEKEGVVTIDYVESRDPVGVNSRVGVYEPAYCTALGKAILAYSPEAEIDVLFTTGKVVSFTSRTIVKRSCFDEECEKVRQGGYAVDDEEFREGVRCIAAPVFGYADTPEGAIGISGPAMRLNKKRVKECAAIVVAVANELTTELRG